MQAFGNRYGFEDFERYRLISSIIHFPLPAFLSGCGLFPVCPDPGRIAKARRTTDLLLPNCRAVAAGSTNTQLFAGLPLGLQSNIVVAYWFLLDSFVPMA